MSSGMNINTAFPGFDFMDYKAIKTTDIENQEMFEGEDVKINKMPLWKSVSIIITFICGLAYGGVNIYDAIHINKRGSTEAIKIYLTIILTFMGLSFGGYKFYMRNNIKESLQTIEKNATKRDANAQIRHNQLIRISNAQAGHNVAQTDLLRSMNTSLASLDPIKTSLDSIKTSLDSIDRSLRRQ